MDDGFEAIVKIPYRITGPQHYATASEAATLHYLLSIGIPVPKVYGYSSSKSNPVGTEYIVMEKASGIGLESRWLSMSKRERHKLASSFVEIEKKLFDIPFGSIGSIYFKKDVPSGLQAALYSTDTERSLESETLCIGPTADYMFWHGKRAGLSLNRGPWKTPKEYLASIAVKEIEWTQRYGKPMELDFPHNGVFPGEKSPEDYLRLLDRYLALTPYLLPNESSDPLNRPTLRHPDLNPNNIFISPDTGAISCIIDWQHATVEPRLLVAGYPRAFENPDPEQSLVLKEPSLPPDYETLPAEGKAEADELHRRRLLFYFYRILNGHFNKAHLEALRDPLLHPRQHLVDRAGRQWSGNLMTLKGALVRMIEYWPHLPGTQGLSCPVQFTPAELDGFHDQEQLWFDLNKVVNHWREEIGGVSEDGWICNERYDETVQRAAELKASLVATAEGDVEDIRLLEKGWLFRDREEFD
ncbi:phosphotransferase enzyme family protein [Aspergillus campestris IBT 28561]|uniref:Phosphotransferase enzyme family protein n=1 Tax=Aspergillus campestris (strain IBT 28561) TaxID=1392248 RepID=A0A2I1D5U1_ASPC2|nr:phosphotransferase enzyme family protein [Aspergillus campestris IBT 28561]PKY05244.1 phosphotransferase enzyme family protein [Aspergillus campestris IBT 28561]